MSCEATLQTPNSVHRIMEELILKLKGEVKERRVPVLIDPVSKGTKEKKKRREREREWSWGAGAEGQVLE